MKRAEGLAIIRKAGYLNNFETLIEVRLQARISHEVALKHFNIGRDIFRQELKNAKVHNH